MLRYNTGRVRTECRREQLIKNEIRKKVLQFSYIFSSSESALHTEVRESLTKACFIRS